MRTRLLRAHLFLLAVLTITATAQWAMAAHTPAEMDALARQYRAQGFAIDWDQDRGLPRTMWNVTLRPQQLLAAPGTPAAIAEEFLSAHAAVLFGRTDVAVGGAQVNAGNTMELRTIRVVESLSGFQVWKLQYVDGLPVDDAWVQTNLDKFGQVISVASKFQPNIVVPEPAWSLNEQQAIAAALARIDNPGQERATPTAELVIMPDGSAGVVTFKTTIPLWSPFGDWVSFVHGRTGEVLVSRDVMIHCKGTHTGRIDIAPPVQGPEPAPRGQKSAAVTGTGMVFSFSPLNGHPELYHLRDGDNVDPYASSMNLERLDGSGLLRGSYVDAQNSDAARANEPTLVYNYSALTLNGHFEEANVYWHVDDTQNYIQTALGITNANNRMMIAYAHQGEDDNSSYSPATKTMRFGDGGVDDSEDGEVVIHEYGHAIHDNIVPGFGGGESGAISEGFGDYIAATRAGNALVAEWDAVSYNPGPPPFLRRTDTNKHYPEDLEGEVHADGEIISSAWWTLRGMLGATLADQIIIESFFLTGTSATMEDFANASVQVDISMYGGAHLGAIYSAYGSHGIGPAYLLEISHTALGDTEDRTGPYAVNIGVVHTSPITGASAVQLHHKLSTDGAFTTVDMTSSGVDTWTANIPGPGVDATVEYYITVVDDQAVSASVPAGAPASVFSFTVGTDVEAPVIVHTPLGNQPLLTWPATVRATVTDNLGLASVSVGWSLNSVAQAPFALVNTTGDNWEADFPLPQASANIGDAIEYTITAVDGSSAANYAYDGPHAFTIIDALGVVLILDDDDSALAGGPKLMPDKSTVDTGTDRTENEKGMGASAMAAVLTTAGYVVTVEDSDTSDPLTWSNYQLVISSSGRDNAPMDNAAYRAALVSYVAAGGKLFVEGGEVGFDAASSPGYPEIVTNVIHAYDWDSDNAGAYVGTPGQEGHPIRVTPHMLPGSVGITYTGNYGDEDAIKPNPEAYLVYGTTSYPLDAGVLVYDDNAAPGSAQIVYMACAYVQITDATVAAHMVENIVAFLLADEGAANSTVSGQVVLQNSVDFSGSTVTITPGGDSFLTGTGGQYVLTGLYPGTYTLNVQGPAGWESTSRLITVNAGSNPNINFELRPVVEVTVCNATPTAIPDNNIAGITSNIAVGTTGTLSNALCSVNITHTWKGDLTIDLVSPNATTVRLHNRTGSSTDNVITSYDNVTAPDGPGVMNNFDGGNADGTWQLKVADRASGDSGTLNNWCVTLTVTQEGSVPTVAGALRAEAADGGVRLTWNTYSIAGVAGFNVLRKVGESGFTAINGEPVVAAKGTTSYFDAAAGLAPGTTLTYRLAVVHTGDAVDVLPDDVQVQLASRVPTKFALEQNQPNPFNPKTTIRFALSAADHTSLRIYDPAGRLVHTLVNQQLEPGVHEVTWDGTDARGQRVATGTYFYQVRSGRFEQTKSMVLVK